MHRALAPALAAALVTAPALAGPHADHAALADAGLLRVPIVSAPPVAQAPPLPQDRPDVMVYGYVPYWADDLDTLRWDALTHVALFTAHAEPDGRLTDTGRWGDVSGALSRAADLDVHVHLTVANFDTAQLRALLGSSSARARLVDALAAEVDRTGAHGVNVDFEGLPADRRAEMVAFTRELAGRVPEVVLATPAVDWSDAWDYGALTDHADLFIMGYGYHWSGSDYAGPVDPLYGGGVWSRYSLSWSVDDYVANGADPERVIVGLPLYGYAWRTASDRVPSAAQARGEVVLYTEGASLVARHGRRLDAGTRTPWAWDGARQAWFSDAASVRERTAWIVESELGGVGFWALNYDARDVELWDGIREETDLDEEPDDSGDTDPPDEPDPPDARWIADAGDPFLAYVGESVQLSAQWSTGPEPHEYRWTQVAGPAARLDDPDAERPRFVVEAAGVHEFEVVVGDGRDFSAPASSFVIAIETDVARRGCACDAPGAGHGGWLALPLLLAFLRRRR